MNLFAQSDVDASLEPIADEHPCGADLAYDPQFLEFELAAQGKPEVQYGGTITPAVAPEWKQIREMGHALLGRTRDLRVVVPFSRALLHLQGFPGFSLGLLLIAGLLTRQWAAVHPQLDPDDDNDPTIRINTLASLVDGATMLRDVKETPFVTSRALGQFSLRDVDIASGEQSVAEGDAKPELSLIEGACGELELASLQAQHQAVSVCIQALGEIEAALSAEVGAAQSINCQPLSKILERLQRFLRQCLAARGAHVGADTSTSADADGLSAMDGAALGELGASHAGRQALSGDISSRDDVLRALDKICRYYDQYEPSSPVPLLLSRAHRLVNKRFIEIMEDLAPEGLNQVVGVSGIQSTSS